MRELEQAGEPVATYEADTDHLEVLFDWDMAKGWRWNRKDFKRGDKLYAHPDPRIAQLEADLAAAIAEAQTLRVALNRIAEMRDRDGSAIEMHRDELRAIAKAAL